MIKTIIKFIKKGGEIKEEYRTNIKNISNVGILDITGKMPLSMYEWVNDISIFSERKLIGHPLKRKLDLAVFHSSNRVRDFDEIMGVLMSLSKDNEHITVTQSEALNNSGIPIQANSTDSNKKYDVFISHANKDKLGYV